jgi:hypothetical protein
VTPNELLGDGIFWHVAEFIQERATLEVDVQAIPETELLFSL